MKRHRAVKTYTKKMRALFEHLDDDCDGLLSLEEFRCVAEDDTIRQWLMSMELDVRDVEAVFHLLDVDHSTRLTMEEVMAGISQLKGPARSLDLASLRHTLR